MIIYEPFKICHKVQKYYSGFYDIHYKDNAKKYAKTMNILYGKSSHKISNKKIYNDKVCYDTSLLVRTLLSIVRI